MAFKKIYEFSGGLYSSTYAVELYLNTTATVSVDTLELIKCTGRFGGDETELDYPIISQIWTLNIIDKNYAANGYLYDVIKDNDLEDIHIKISKNGANIFSGTVILSGFNRKYDPILNLYELSVKAVDGFSQLKKLKTKDIALSNPYETIQATLDTLGHGLDTYWYVDLNNEYISPSYKLDGYKLHAESDTYSYLLAFLKIYGFRMYQGTDRWVIFEESYIGDVYAPPSKLFSRYIDYYKIESSTYNKTSGVEGIGNAGSPNYSYARYFDNDFQEGVGIDMFSPLSKVGIEYDIYNPREDSSTLINDAYFQILYNENITTNTVTESNLSSLNVDLDPRFTLKLDITLTGNKIASFNYVDNTTYTAEIFELKFITPSQTYWLNNLNNWQTTQYIIDISFDVDGSGNLTNDKSTKLIQDTIEFPDTTEEGYIETVAYLNQDANNGFLSLDADVEVDYVGLIEKTRAVGYSTRGNNSQEVISDFSVEYSFAISPNDINWRSDKRDYKLAETAILKKMGRNYRRMQKFVGVMNTIMTPVVHAVYTLPDFTSGLYRILYINYNLFEEKSEVAFVEWDYSETGITVDRGIYS